MLKNLMVASILLVHRVFLRLHLSCGFIRCSGQFLLYLKLLPPPHEFSALLYEFILYPEWLFAHLSLTPLITLGPAPPTLTKQATTPQLTPIK